MFFLNKNRIKRGVGDSFIQVAIYLFCGVAAILTILPFIYVIAGSFATERELTERSFFLIPHVFSLDAYRYIVHNGDAFRGLWNSIIVTVCGTTINMLFSCTFAYPISRKYLKGRTAFTNMVIIIMLFSGGMIPSYLLIANVLHLRDTFWALWLPGAISPFNMLIIKNYFQGIPVEMEEASIIDGCNDLQIFTRIILPLSKPVIASVSLFYAVGHWNAYFDAMMYISDHGKEVIQIVLRRIIFLTSNASTEGLDMGYFALPPEKAIKMATTVVAVVPILIVYPFIQKYFTKGVMVGSVKG